MSLSAVRRISSRRFGARASAPERRRTSKKIYAKIEEWRKRPIDGAYPHLYLDGIVMKRTWAGEVRLAINSGIVAGGGVF